MHKIQLVDSGSFNVDARSQASLILDKCIITISIIIKQARYCGRKFNAEGNSVPITGRKLETSYVE